MEMRNLFHQVKQLLFQTLRPFAARAEKYVAPVLERHEWVRTALARAGIHLGARSADAGGGAGELGQGTGGGADGAALNDKEQRVLAILVDGTASAGRAMSLTELAQACFATEPDRERANSWVRNSLRRLVRERWAERVDRGAYRATGEGVARAAAER